ncbi:MAG: LysR family transcriptional regulator, partial [Streptomyces sp.]
MDLELRHLKTIRAIADAGSLTKAATALGLAQPALSAQLKRIERALGGELFERGRHGVRATALGEFVLARARVVLPAVSGLREEALRFG